MEYSSKKNRDESIKDMAFQIMVSKLWNGWRIRDARNLAQAFINIVVADGISLPLSKELALQVETSISRPSKSESSIQVWESHIRRSVLNEPGERQLALTFQTDCVENGQSKVVDNVDWCPSCSRLFWESEGNCPGCGREFKKGVCDSDERVGKALIAVGAILCQKCKKLVVSDDGICPNCQNSCNSADN